MQSDRPTPGNPWPHDMVIAVSDADHLLLPLLFISEAWNLEIPGVPPLDPPPPIGTSLRPGTATVEEWRTRWRDAWNEGVAAAGAKPEAPVDDAAMQVWVRQWLDQLPLPFTQIWGIDGFDADAYRSWVSAVRGLNLRRIDEHPERRALPALVGAWRRGLRTVVTLPFAVDWSAQGGPHHLLIAARTRDNTEAYSTRLGLFGTMPPQPTLPGEH
jgi:hypothetical protein